MRTSSKSLLAIARRSLFAFGYGICLLACGTAAQAQSPPDVTAGELALLPEYCVDTMGFSYAGPGSGRESPRAREWVTRMGMDFWWMHHYCWGLIKFDRAMRPGVSAMHRANGIKTAIKEYELVMNRTSPDFVMLPELLLRRGEALLALGDVANALASFEAALRRKPDYWPASHRMAEVMLKAGTRERARSVLERGLTATPGQPVLLELYVRAGGKPEALPPPAAAAPSAPATAASAASAAR